MSTHSLSETLLDKPKACCLQHINVKLCHAAPHNVNTTCISNKRMCVDTALGDVFKSYAKAEVSKGKHYSDNVLPPVYVGLEGEENFTVCRYR